MDRFNNIFEMKSIAYRIKFNANMVNNIVVHLK